MGLFSSKKTYVSSVAYNLAGDEDKRINYLQSMVVTGVVTEPNFSISSTLQSGYRNGPGMKIRRFFNWALDNYNYIGVPRGSFNTSVDLDDAVVKTQVPHAAGTDLMVQDISAGQGEYSYWSDQYMLEHHPALIDSNWISDIDDAGLITITFEDTTTVSFTPADYSRDGLYIYVAYNETQDGIDEPVTTGPTVSIGSGGVWPDVTGWNQLSTSTSAASIPLTTTVETLVSYSDETPDEAPVVTESSSPGNYTDYSATYERSTYMGQEPVLDRIISLVETQVRGTTATAVPNTTTTTTNEDMGGGVTKTTTVNTTVETLSVDRHYRNDSQQIIQKNWGPTKLWIYKFGSGNTILDGMKPSLDVSQGEFYPFIPIRIENQFLSEYYYPEAYEVAKKAYYKATGGKYADIVQSLTDNEDLKEIDHAYVMFGVSLNVRENACRNYLFNFFEKMLASQTVSTGAVTTWANSENNRFASLSAWAIWKSAQQNPSSPLYGIPEPGMGNVTTIPNNVINIRSTGAFSSKLNIEISWKLITKTTGTGLKKPGAKKGEVWLELQPGTIEDVFLTYSRTMFVNKNNSDRSIFEITRQIDSNHWESLRVVGLVHENKIYDGKSVVLSAKDALIDNDETGFIIPLHNETFREMSLVDATQMSTACAFMVLNCYKVVKTGFFGSGFFKILMFVAIVAVSVATMGGAAPGLLGTAASVGSAVGLSGLAAVIVGTAINALVGMIVMKLVGLVAVAAFGEKIGTIVAMVASFAVMEFQSGAMEGMSFSQVFNELMKAENLLKITSAIGGGVTALMAMNSAEMVAKTQGLIENYEKESAKVAELYAANIGYDNVILDVMSLTETGFGNYQNNSSASPAEKLDTFLSRTLLTGSEIAELSHDMLNNFTRYTLSTDINNA